MYKSSERNIKYSHQVYNDLKFRIMTLSLEPGTVLKETELGLEYGLSRTPVREALKQLQSDTFIVQNPNFGIQVAPISMQNFTELLQLREALELLSVRLASLNIDEEGILMLKENIQKQKYCIDHECSPIDYLQLDRNFHVLIAQEGGNKRLPKLIAKYHDLLYRYDVYCSRDNQFLYSITEHDYIYQAIASRDMYTAIHRMTEHLSNLNKIILVRLSKKLLPQL